MRKVSASMEKIITVLIACACLTLAGCGDTSVPANFSANSSSSANTSSDPGFSSSSSPSDSSVPVSPINDASSSDNSVPSEDAQASDNRGIPGMDPYPLRTVLESEPFYLKMMGEAPAPAEDADLYASTCSMTNKSDGIIYDYIINTDNDGEVVKATFGVINSSASSDELLKAAELYFYVVSLMGYDTSDEEALFAWISENLPTVADAGEDGVEITIGDAKYSFCGLTDEMYLVDISKADGSEPAEPAPSENAKEPAPDAGWTTEQKNAMALAMSYLSFSPFSHDRLVEQLEYEKYSHESAVWAADNCGADWSEQALSKAKEYLDTSAFSYTGLIEQLEFEGFTHEQAVYGVEQNGY